MNRSGNEELRNIWNAVNMTPEERLTMVKAIAISEETAFYATQQKYSNAEKKVHRLMRFFPKKHRDAVDALVNARAELEQLYLQTASKTMIFPEELADKK